MRVDQVEWKRNEMKKFKILIVDDDFNLAYLLRQRLEHEDFEVETANSVAEAYLLYLAFRPDLVLTDITMGEENGLDLMRHVRLHNPTVATIYMTGDLIHYWSELETEREVNHAGVLEKPFSGRKLLESISAQAQGRSQIAA
jgi:DNA-binding response OmpR family regulator